MMVDCGPVGPITCPNDAACWHDIEQHRYEPDRQRWVCAVEDCHENPERRVRHLPGGLVVPAPPALRPDYDLLTESRRERRRRLGLHWWQREGG